MQATKTREKKATQVTPSINLDMLFTRHVIRVLETALYSSIITGTGLLIFTQHHLRTRHHYHRVECVEIDGPGTPMVCVRWKSF